MDPCPGLALDSACIRCVRRHPVRIRLVSHNPNVGLRTFILLLRDLYCLDALILLVEAGWLPRRMAAASGHFAPPDCLALHNVDIVGGRLPGTELRFPPGAHLFWIALAGRIHRHTVCRLCHLAREVPPTRCLARSRSWHRSSGARTRTKIRRSSGDAVLGGRTPFPTGEFG